jgi:hypothetical protein
VETGSNNYIQKMVCRPPGKHILFSDQRCSSINQERIGIFVFSIVMQGMAVGILVNRIYPGVQGESSGGGQ